MRKTALTEAERNPFDGTPRPVPVRIRRTTLDGKEAVVKAHEERTMRIKLNSDYTACLDGIHPTAFAAGQEAEIPERIAAVLLEDGRASLPAAAKALEGAPENKMLDGPSGNKGDFKRGGRRK
jgi:hypothetical protein